MEGYTTHVAQDRGSQRWWLWRAAWWSLDHLVGGGEQMCWHFESEVLADALRLHRLRSLFRCARALRFGSDQLRQDVTS